MYYKEKIENGIVYVKHTPNGNWMPIIQFNENMMSNMLQSEYQTKYKQFQQGLISKKEWEQYTMDLLFNILETPEVKEILIRLKD